MDKLGVQEYRSKSSQTKSLFHCLPTKKQKELEIKAYTEEDLQGAMMSLTK